MNPEPKNRYKRYDEAFKRVVRANKAKVNGSASQ
jgi:hypothetical protein